MIKNAIRFDSVENIVNNSKAKLLERTTLPNRQVVQYVFYSRNERISLEIKENVYGGCPIKVVRNSVQKEGMKHTSIEGKPIPHTKCGMSYS